MKTSCFAVVGDVHGAMWTTIRLLQGWEKARRRKLDFVLQVGDCEPHRDDSDLATMAAPAKYRQLGDFASFARGQTQFPWPIYFIGGNHEPYGWLETMPNGGQVAPNCHFIGRANVVSVGELRVAGLSGIFKPELFASPRSAVSRFHELSNKDWIGWNEGDILRLCGLGPADVLLLHEWPSTFDAKQRHPPDEAGRAWIELVLDSLRPKMIFCGHLHARYRSAIRVGVQTVPVECLAQVASGRDAFAVYELENGELRDV